MKTRRIALIRHGEVAGQQCFRGSTDDPLSEVGLQQMYAAAAPHGPWSAVISSPLQRCAVFAKAFARTQTTACITDPDWQELHFGAWEGKTTEDVMATDPDGLKQFWETPETFTPPDAETLLAFQERVLRGWDAVLERHRSGGNASTLVVTHGGVIRLLLCHLHGVPLDQLLAFEVPYAARVWVDVDDEQVTLGADAPGIP
jgi:broad specificity phosphatase PhoE